MVAPASENGRWPGIDVLACLAILLMNDATVFIRAAFSALAALNVLAAVRHGWNRRHCWDGQRPGAATPPRADPGLAGVPALRRHVYGLRILGLHTSAARDRGFGGRGGLRSDPVGADQCGHLIPVVAGRERPAGPGRRGDSCGEGGVGTTGRCRGAVDRVARRLGYRTPGDIDRLGRGARAGGSDRRRGRGRALRPGFGCTPGFECRLPGAGPGGSRDSYEQPGDEHPNQYAPLRNAVGGVAAGLMAIGPSWGAGQLVQVSVAGVVVDVAAPPVAVTPVSDGMEKNEFSHAAGAAAVMLASLVSVTTKGLFD